MHRASDGPGARAHGRDGVGGSWPQQPDPATNLVLTRSEVPNAAAAASAILLTSITSVQIGLCDNLEAGLAECCPRKHFLGIIRTHIIQESTLGHTHTHTGCFGAPLPLLFRAVGDRLGTARIYPLLSQIPLLSNAIVSGSWLGFLWGSCSAFAPRSFRGRRRDTDSRCNRRR